MEVEGPIVAERSPSLGRKRLSDITNMASRRSGPDKGCHERPITAKDYISHLLKENNALLRLVEERNKIIEVSGMELQSLKLSLQKANQQNWQLAQANSQMLAELNLGKDRLKALQHELGCTVAVLKTKTLELEEEKKLKKQGEVLRERISHETLKEWHRKPAEVARDPSYPANCKKPCNGNRKRKLRSRSLGPTIVAHQETTKEKEEGTKPAEVSEDLPYPANCKKACNTNTKKRTLRSRSLGPAIVVAHQETTKEKEEGRMSPRRRSSNLRADELHEQDLFGIEDVKLPVPSDSVGKKAETEGERTVSPRSQGQELRRASLGGRPLRRAAEKVCSYKEVPVNVKMRRPD